MNKLYALKIIGCILLLLESSFAQDYKNENKEIPALRIASWNISWLGDSENDLNPRTDEDIQRLRQ